MNDGNDKKNKNNLNIINEYDPPNCILRTKI